jgi:guanylate kinase
MSKRIILVGPTCAGKNFMRDKFQKAGYQADVSYTTRMPREGEKNTVDYNFISKNAFESMIEKIGFYEWVQYGGNYYGTGLKEWKWCDIFIMETDGIKHIKPEDRKNCLIIYVNTPVNRRILRMRERGWDNDKIYERILVDEKKFEDFTDFDVEISSDKQVYMFDPLYLK